MEASYVTEMQWAGQDKKDTVACEVVHWVQVAKDRAQGRRVGVYTQMDLISYKMVENLTKMADKLPLYQVPLVLENAGSPPITAVSHNGALKALFGSRLTRLMR
jgi:hypothetical protein